nr:hypothetical protein [Tanacetum cinerariifolium]
MAEDDEEKTWFHTEEEVYCFTHMPKELKNSAATLQMVMEKDLVQDIEETLKLKRVNIKIDPITSSFEVKEGMFLGHMVTKEGVRAGLEKVQTIILSPTPKSPNQVRSLFLQLTAISKFIPKLAELKYPISEVRMRFETEEGSGWTNEAEKSLRMIKRKLNKLQTLFIPKEGEVLMLCLRQRNETISSVMLVEREGIQIHVSYVSRPLQGMEICYAPTKKMLQALIHTTRSLRAVFRKHKVKVRMMEKVLADQRGRNVEIYLEEIVIKSENEQDLFQIMEETLRKLKRVNIKIDPITSSFRVKKGRAEVPHSQGPNEVRESRRIWLDERSQRSPPKDKKEIEQIVNTGYSKGRRGIILVSPDEEMHSYAIRLKLNTSDHAIDCEALLAGLAASVRKGMKDLHVFMDSPKLVSQTKRNHMPATEQEKKYKK